MRRKLIILAGAFVLLNTIDIILTLMIVKVGGGTELNPIMAKVLGMPTPAIIAFKVLGSAIMMTALLLLPSRFYKLQYSVLRVVTAVMVGVVLFNITGL